MSTKMGFPELIHSQYIVAVDDPITHLQKNDGFANSMIKRIMT